MKVKSKITLGLVFLFSVIVALGIIAMNYLNSLNVENQRTLQENYKGVTNIYDLGQALGQLGRAFEPKENSRVTLNRIQAEVDSAISAFEHSLKRQKANNTDLLQSAILDTIQTEFARLEGVVMVTRTKNYYFEKFLPLRQSIQSRIDRIFKLNQETINQRNEAARETAQHVIYTVAVIVVFCILVAFSFMVSFPRYVAEPVEAITQVINQVKEGDYSKRVALDTKDEFGSMANAFNELTERLEAFEKLNLDKLMLEKNRLDTLIKKINEGIIGLDADFNFAFMNPFAKRVLGLSGEKVKGKPAIEMANGFPLIKGLVDDLIRWQKSGERYTRNMLIKGELNGAQYYFVRKIIVIYGSEPDAKVNGYVLMLKNITEFKEQDEARRNFIATVSHELKTPIAAIKMSLKLLKDERLSKLTADQEELVETVEMEIARLLNISQELLNANEMEEGKLNLYPRRLKVSEVVDEAVDSVWTLAEDKHIKLTEILPEEPTYIMADFDKLIWVLVNLLTNAIKYSNANTEITVKVQQQANQIYFDVIDQGQGISEEELEQIFKRYYRAKNVEGKGTGLGLAISKGIVEQMGGTIKVVSELGKGSTFTIALPVGEL